MRCSLGWSGAANIEDSESPLHGSASARRQGGRRSRPTRSEPQVSRSEPKASEDHPVGRAKAGARARAISECEGPAKWEYHGDATEACMNFDFSEEQKLLQKTARDYLAQHCGLDVCRSVLESNGTHSDALWKGVAEMGWLGAAVPEEYGGAGFSRLELALIAFELGRALAPIPFGPSAYLVSEALLEFGSDEQKKRYLPRLASGEL